MSEPALSLVIPVRNEAGNIAPLFAEIDAALGGTDHEVVFVDDGSADETAAEIDATGARLVVHAQGAGKTEALRTGVAAARAPVVVTLDGDGQDDPRDIVRLRAALAADVRLVCGWRRNRADGAWRRLCSWIGNSVRRLVLRDGVPDTACGLKAFYRADFLALPGLRNMHRFLPALYRGAKVVSVPVNHRPRRHGVSKYGVHNRLWPSLVDLCAALKAERVVGGTDMPVEPERPA